MILQLLTCKKGDLKTSYCTFIKEFIKEDKQQAYIQ